MLFNFLKHSCFLFAPEGDEGEGGDFSKEAFEKLRAENEKINKSYERVVNESTTYKNRAQTAESKLSEFEKNKAKESGDLKKQLELEQQSHLKTKTSLKTIQTKALESNLKAEALKFAKDAHDIDTVLNIDKHRNLLKINEENLTVEGVEDFVKAVRKSHNFLFSKTKMPPTENKKSNNEPDNKQLNDREQYSKELAECKTSKELQAVKEKWKDKKTWVK